MIEFATPQESFWAGNFGDEWTDRNGGTGRIASVASNTALFSRIFARTSQVKSVLELGASRGVNLHAIKQLLPDAAFSGPELNDKVVQELWKLDWVETIHASILDFKPKAKSDFVFGSLFYLDF